MASTNTGKPSDYRLPLNVKPTHYDLTFKTDLEASKFWGYGIIDLEVLEDTKAITFNSTGLELTEASVVDLTSGLTHQQASTSVDSKQERVQLDFPATFSKGSNVQLRLGWKAELGNSMLGYYLSSFTHEGKKKNYSLTQFEPTAARRAFPSWDEPLLKAAYTITLISKSDTVNLSNMPATSEIPFGGSHSKGCESLIKLFPFENESSAKNDWKITSFEKSPPMSSYLVAFANGDFVYLEDSYKSPLSGTERKLRIYTTPDVIHQAHFGLEVKKRCLPVYEQIFDVEFPLPKLDTLVAADFDAGAMENWGLITGRTTAFLFDPKKSSLAAKKRVAVVQAHECAHMWFGDITTMAWWDSLWLNEGFATLMGEVIILSRLFPEWKPHSAFINDHLSRALDLDAKKSSHPIQVDCPDANQINQIFDSLSYSKAGSMLRMLSEYVGEEKFLKGVSIYLKKHLYANSEPIDLWNGIAEATGLDIAKMMDNWTYKIGYPVLTVKEENGKLHIRQDRFLASGDVKDEDNKTLWYIPLNVLSTDASGKASIDRKTVQEGREITIPVDISKPFKLNAGTSGVYRVAYTPERLKQLGEWAAQKDSVFTLEDRMGLVSDAVVLAKAGVGKTSAAFDLVEKLSGETENLVWQSIDSSLASASNLLWEESDEVRERFYSFQRFLFVPLVKKYGFEYNDSESPDVRELRTLAINRAANSKDQGTTDKLRALFAKFQETGDHSIIPSDLVTAAYMTAVEQGGRAEYDYVKSVYNKPPTPSARISALVALARSKEYAHETLGMLTNGEVPLQDWHSVFASMGNLRSTRRLLTQWFKDNYDDIMKRYEGNFSISYLIKYTFQYYTSNKDADEIRAWFEGKDVSKFNLALEQSIETIRDNATWWERSKNDILTWLTEFEKRNGSKQ